MSRQFDGPSLNPDDKRDPFFERLVREEESSVQVLGVSYDPVDIIQLDPTAYEESRRKRLSEIQESLQADLSNESYRRLEKLASLIPKGGVVPFIGAGMSVASGYPSWGGYLRDLAPDWMEESVVQKYLDSGDLETLASEIQTARGASSFEESLAEFDRQFPPSEEDYLLFDLFNGSMVTTNFDDLLENAAAQLERPYTVREGCDTWAGWVPESNAGGDKVILKLHGHHARPHSRVLLKDQYEKAYGADGAVQRDLRGVFTTSCVVFIGCSLANDRTMEIALRVQSERPLGESRRHYAFLAATHDRVARERFLTERGIFPIWYPNDNGDHATLGLMLWWLKDEVGSANV
jgi:hypothetical protein